MTASRSKAVPALVLSIACFLAAALGVLSTNFDFRAFYCAGSIASQHGDPYLQEPLHSCERALPGDPFRPYSATTALPVPLPGYAIAAFVPLSRLPFAIAARVWTVVLLLSVAIAIASTTLLTGLPVAVVAATFLLSLCAGSVGLGELVPVCIAALCLSALMAEKGRWVAASLAAAVCLIEPHLGLPIVLSLAIWARESRLPLLAACLTLGGISVALLGLTANVEYFSGVLPSHALSEIASDAQLSFSVILNGLDVAPHAAITAGAVSYCIAVVGGIVAAGLLARRFGSGAFIVLTPAATSLIGGTFIHVTQMAAALPLVLLLASRSSRYRLLFIAIAALLAVPWRIIGSPPLIIASAIVVFYIAWELSYRNLRIGACFGAAALVVLLAINLGMPSPPMHAGTSLRYSQLIDSRYAEASWAHYNEQYLSTREPERWIRRTPTWLGLLLLGITIAALCYRPTAARDPRIVTAWES